ncbi:MAG: hypothetical protein ACK4NU_02175 [Brevundimonas sp.]
MTAPTEAWPILPSEGRRWDCLALGEVMLRFDSGEDRVRSARSFRVWEAAANTMSPEG